MAALEIRPAAPGEAPLLRDIARAAYAQWIEVIGREPRPMTDDYEQVLAEWDVIICENAGTPVGLLVTGPDRAGFLGPDGASFVLENVAVVPSAHGTGVGQALLTHAESEARRQGHDAIGLYTHHLMAANIALYERIGYVEYERRDLLDTTIVFMRKPLARSGAASPVSSPTRPR